MPFNPLEDYVRNRRRDFDADLPAGLWDRIEKDLKDKQQGDCRKDDEELEDFISANRSAFDTGEPSVDVWKKISRELSGKKATMVVHRSRFNYRAAAAAAVLVLAATLFLGREIGIRAMKQQQLAAIEAIAPEFSEMEDYYRGEIESTYRTVSQVNDDPVLREDLAAIDQAMTELKRELTEVPKEEQPAVIAKLIESYRIKLEILQNILDKLPPAAVEGGAKTTKHESISL